VIDVSVVVPTHNRMPLLSSTMISVLGQKGVVLELVVVDDGSTDGTGPWLDRRAAEDRRIKVVHHARPQLMSAARNAGIARASAPWVAFCDDDDLWAPDKLVTQLRALEQNRARWSCTGVVSIDERLEIVGHHRVKGGDLLSDMLAENLIPSGSSVVAELDLVRKLGGFDPSLPGCEDWDMWIRLAQCSPLAAVDRPLIGYRLGIVSMSMDTGRMRTGRAMIMDRYAGLAEERGIKPTKVRHERYLAKQLLRAGLGKQAAYIFLSLAIKHGQWRELSRAPAALVAPRWTDRVGTARAAAAVPPDWLAEAALWLRPLRDANVECLPNLQPDHRTDDQFCRV
jgi:glycosyltransferase involved in cell wall biosynthesis